VEGVLLVVVVGAGVVTVFAVVTVLEGAGVVTVVF
jgi:hypothetical protein